MCDGKGYVRRLRAHIKTKYSYKDEEHAEYGITV